MDYEKKKTTKLYHSAREEDVVDNQSSRRERSDSVTYHIRATSPGSSRFKIRSSTLGADKMCGNSMGSRKQSVVSSVMMRSRRVRAEQSRSLCEEDEEQQHLPLKKRMKYTVVADSSIIDRRERFSEEVDSICRNKPRVYREGKPSTPNPMTAENQRLEIPALKHKIHNSSLASQTYRESIYNEKISSKECIHGKAVRKGMRSIPATPNLVNAKDVYFHSNSSFSADSMNRSSQGDDDPAESTSTITSERQEKSSLDLFSLPLKWLATGKRSSRKNPVSSNLDTHRHAHSAKFHQLDVPSATSLREDMKGGKTRQVTSRKSRFVFDDQKLVKAASSVVYPKPKKASSSSYKFKCTTCSKSFSTHQALGGHRSSHYDRNNDYPKSAAATPNGIAAKEKKGTIEDPISSCSSLGNTLDSDLSHQIGSSLVNTRGNDPSRKPGSSAVNTLDNVLSDQRGSRKVFDFDLNELPPMEDDEEVDHHLTSTSVNTPQPHQASSCSFQ